ncbi:MAG: hypothetical protein MHM6MM_002917 [Cercozoa sp. M6MM]
MKSVSIEEDAAMSKRMASLLPVVIKQHILDRPEGLPDDEPFVPEMQEVTTVALFADVSGFTKLSESLQARGPEGIELLGFYLNRYLERLVRYVGAGGGDVFKFAGDAMLILWPPPKARPTAKDLAYMLHGATQCCLGIQEEMHNAELAKEVFLSVKLGIGVGTAIILHVGGEYKRVEYLACGKPLNQAYAAEAACHAGDVVLSEEAYRRIEDHFEAEEVPEHPGFFRIKACLKRVKQAGIGKAFMKNAHMQNFRSTMQQYIPAAVVPYFAVNQNIWAAELRNITIMFINIQFKCNLHKCEVVTEEAMQEVQMVTSMIQQAIYKFEGSLNKFNVDDKGSIILAVFGLAPLAHSDFADAARATLAAIELEAMLRRVGVPSAIGITSGFVLCSLVGTSTRREYTVLGDTVNLSARLMQAAMRSDKYKILCNRATQNVVSSKTSRASQLIDFEELEPIPVKGKKEKVTVYAPRKAFATMVSSLERPRISQGSNERNTAAAWQQTAAVEEYDRSTLASIVSHTHAARISGMSHRFVRQDFERTLSLLASDLPRSISGSVLLLDGDVGCGKSHMSQQIERKCARAMKVISVSGVSTTQALPSEFEVFRMLFERLFTAFRPFGGCYPEEWILRAVERCAPDCRNRLYLLNFLLGTSFPEGVVTREAVIKLAEESEARGRPRGRSSAEDWLELGDKSFPVDDATNIEALAKMVFVVIGRITSKYSQSLLLSVDDAQFMTHIDWLLALHLTSLIRQSVNPSAPAMQYMISASNTVAMIINTRPLSNPIYLPNPWSAVPIGYLKLKRMCVYVEPGSDPNILRAPIVANLNVPPLSPEDSKSFVKALTSTQDVSAKATQILHEMSGGRPLLLEKAVNCGLATYVLQIITESKAGPSGTAFNKTLRTNSGISWLPLIAESRRHLRNSVIHMVGPELLMHSHSSPDAVGVVLEQELEQQQFIVEFPVPFKVWRIAAQHLDRIQPQHQFILRVASCMCVAEGLCSNTFDLSMLKEVHPISKYRNWERLAADAQLLVDLGFLVRTEQRPFLVHQPDIDTTGVSVVSTASKRNMARSGSRDDIRLRSFATAERTDSDLAGAAENRFYSFTYGFMRECVYQLMLFKQRRKLHSAIADYLEQVYPDHVVFSEIAIRHRQLGAHEDTLDEEEAGIERRRSWWKRLLSCCTLSMHHVHDTAARTIKISSLRRPSRSVTEEGPPKLSQSIVSTLRMTSSDLAFLTQDLGFSYDLSEVLPFEQEFDDLQQTPWKQEQLSLQKVLRYATSVIDIESIASETQEIEMALSYLSSPDTLERQHTGESVPPIARLTLSHLNAARNLFRFSNDWNFSLFMLNDNTEGMPLLFMGYCLFSRLNLFERLGIDELKCVEFLRTVEAGYNEKGNPYHNSMHAADVAQSSLVLARALEQDTDWEPQALDLFCLLLAGVIHDFRHPGLSNEFLVSSCDQIARLFKNDKVLENYHALAAFSVLRHPKMCILESIPEDKYPAVKARVIDLVLSTNLSTHFEFIDEVKSRTIRVEAIDVAGSHEIPDDNAVLESQHSAKSLPLPGSDLQVERLHVPTTGGAPLRLSTVSIFSSASEHLGPDLNAPKPPHRRLTEGHEDLLLALCIKCADVGNPAKCDRLSCKWANRITREFYMQGAREREAVRPVSKFMDDTVPNLDEERALSQIQFIRYIVSPIFELAGELCPSIDKFAVAQLKKNYRNSLPSLFCVE